MGLIEGTKEAPSKLNNLKFNPETERIEFEKDMAASSYELEVYKKPYEFRCVNENIRSSSNSFYCN